MSKKFSIYDTPFSEETKVIRRNSLIASGLSLFIGLTGELPKQFSLLGVSFSSQQQETMSWFIFTVSAYLFLHFLSVGGVEFAKWVHPFLSSRKQKEILLTRYSHAFWDDDFGYIPTQVDEADKADMARDALEEAHWKVQSNLRMVYRLIYVRLFLEIIVPLVLGGWGLYELAVLIGTSFYI
ncbi:SMODS and SLOG-associating 2TM effector domain-containing protein [Vibrio crassostreae]|uniref:Uncharacterized protein n=1 Tax=Vibrio crassostreae TaxID=246167 RepID=A0A822MUL0_9VIBR|nr:hypothetical protein [Vibrio crassostreae]MDH5950389.1 hypothetical protein [Vibrio crassostreae]TCN06172.1 hypothetical protein EDB35_114151 [Vibrio crassostreae]TCU05418.1 hypothetical protein EDB32_1165 [Vibrio crassostreae]CAK1770883.1 SMODS and SLOG-associating 2TM effector domain-containing protein [Vibrio crassostreae]CAK1777931.1 SMODS and SLOG-associating 2TM effector domain-containing protein [Vibrio crassostreae]